MTTPAATPPVPAPDAAPVSSPNGGNGRKFLARGGLSERRAEDLQTRAIDNLANNLVDGPLKDYLGEFAEMLIVRGADRAVVDKFLRLTDKVLPDGLHKSGLRQVVEVANKLEAVQKQVADQTKTIDALQRNVGQYDTQMQLAVKDQIGNDLQELPNVVTAAVSKILADLPAHIAALEQRPIVTPDQVQEAPRQAIASLTAANGPIDALGQRLATLETGLATLKQAVQDLKPALASPTPVATPSTAPATVPSPAPANPPAPVNKDNPPKDAKVTKISQGWLKTILMGGVAGSAILTMIAILVMVVVFVIKTVQQTPNPPDQPTPTAATEEKPSPKVDFSKSLIEEDK